MSSNTPTPHKKFTIRRRVFKLFGSAFDIYDSHGSTIAFYNQEGIIKEDFKLYTNENKSDLLISIQAESIEALNTIYSVTLPNGTSIGSFYRKELKSSFIRSQWIVTDSNQNEIATILEQGNIRPFLRRLFSSFAFLFSQRYKVTRNSDAHLIAELRQHFNPFIFRLRVTIVEQDDTLDDLLILGASCLISAIEGRQDA